MNFEKLLQAATKRLLQGPRSRAWASPCRALGQDSDDTGPVRHSVGRQVWSGAPFKPSLVYRVDSRRVRATQKVTE